MKSLDSEVLIWCVLLEPVLEGQDVAFFSWGNRAGPVIFVWGTFGWLGNCPDVCLVFLLQNNGTLSWCYKHSVSFIG